MEKMDRGKESSMPERKWVCPGYGATDMEPAGENRFDMICLNRRIFHA